ncbi:uncharacterized protein LOC134748396 [Cydia strobilella]|uniref:uncharacterized protein LOC134748396 n=1 Tax=Cydia strobilella TaxID=1100964 RepID=UPI00300590C1
MYYQPTGYTLEDPAGEALSEELQDALVCSECCADCARPVYRVTASYAPYFGRHKSVFLDKFTHGLSLINTSVFHFFYSSEDQYLYAVMSNSDWYETIGSISSQCVILLGISLVSVFELVFHCTVRWRHHYKRRKRLRIGQEAFA